MSPYMVANSFLEAGVETTKGTLASTLRTIPIREPQVTAQQKRLRDEGLRGSPGDLYNLVAGVRNDEYACKGDVFADSIPVFLRGILGSTDTVTAAPSSTTLSSTAAANATSISTAATIASGSIVVIGTGATQETHLTTGVTGAGPFTVTLSLPLRNQQLLGNAVTGLTTHKIGLQNDQVGSQPPSISIQDFDGAGAFQLLGGQMDELKFTLGAEEAFMFDAKMLTYPFTTISAPSNTLTTEIFPPAWSGITSINNATSAVLLNAEIDIKRGTKALFTQGQQSPHSIFAGPISVSGTMKFIVESGDTTLTTGLATDPVPVVFSLWDPNSGHMTYLQMSQVQLFDPKRERGDIEVAVSCSFVAQGNATDAVDGGDSWLLAYVGNAVTTAY